jgi:hypothetical protein
VTGEMGWASGCTAEILSRRCLNRVKIDKTQRERKTSAFGRKATEFFRSDGRTLRSFPRKRESRIFYVGPLGPRLRGDERKAGWLQPSGQRSNTGHTKFRLAAAGCRSSSSALLQPANRGGGYARGLLPLVPDRADWGALTTP